MDPSVRYFIKDLYIADWFTSSDDTLDDQYVSPTHLFLPPIGLVEKQLRILYYLMMLYHQNGKMKLCNWIIMIVRKCRKKKTIAFICWS